MKIWIELGSCSDQGVVFVHATEPNPVIDDDNEGDCYWETKNGDVGIEVMDEDLNRLLKRGMKKDTVAEFELKCIWERVEE